MAESKPSQTTVKMKKKWWNKKENIFVYPKLFFSFQKYKCASIITTFAKTVC